MGRTILLPKNNKTHKQKTTDQLHPRISHTYYIKYHRLIYGKSQHYTLTRLSKLNKLGANKVAGDVLTS